MNASSILKLELKSYKFRKINFANSPLNRGKRWEIYGWRQWVTNINDTLCEKESTSVVPTVRFVEFITYGHEYLLQYWMWKNHQNLQTQAQTQLYNRISSQD